MSDELKEQLPIFVYGTLRPGASAFHKVKPYIREIHSASATGFDMYLCGNFPVLLREPYNTSKVTGELLWGHSESYEILIKAIDVYEGEGWLFKREGVIAYDEVVGIYILAYVYVGLEPGLVIDKSKKIPHLDWFNRGEAA